MPHRSRHPKKDIEAALRAAEAAGWTVEEIHRGHRWVSHAAPQASTR